MTQRARAENGFSWYMTNSGLLKVCIVKVDSDSYRFFGCPW